MGGWDDQTDFFAKSPNFAFRFARRVSDASVGPGAEAFGVAGERASAARQPRGLTWGRSIREPQARQVISPPVPFASCSAGRDQWRSRSSDVVWVSGSVAHRCFLFRCMLVHVNARQSCRAGHQQRCSRGVEERGVRRRDGSLSAVRRLSEMASWMPG